MTLLETLLALTILSMAGAVVYSSLATILSSWRTGVSRGRDRQVAQVALDRLTGQLKSAVPAVVRGDSGPVPAFTVGDDSLRFVTLLPVSGRPVAQVSYSIEEGEHGRRLVYREYPWPDKDFSEGGGDPWLEEAVEEIEGMAVLIRARGGEGEEPGEEDFPGEAEISFLVSTAAGDRGQDEGDFRTVVPIMAEPFQPGP